MPRKKTNPRISAALVQALQGEPAYANQKAFSATRAFLRRVIYFCQRQEYAEIAAKYIKEQFKNSGVKYKECLDALVRQNILEIDKQYIVGAKPRGYKLTERGIELMTAGELVYLRALFKDAKLKRQLQKQASYHRTKAKKLKDAFLQYVSESLKSYEFAEQAVDFIERSDWPPLTKADALTTLADFSQRKFTKPKHNKTDGRVWNEFVGMKSDLRRFFRKGKMRYRFVIDIRSCHPLFLAHYLVNHAKKRGWQTHHPLLPGDHQKTIVENDAKLFRERSERKMSFLNTAITNSPSIPPISNNPSNKNLGPHYDGVNSDILAELERWNLLFTNPATDPKAMLATELGYLRQSAKDALNTTINGSQKYQKFIKWFKQEFPLLHNVWERTDSAEVGNEISANYETELMQDMELYRLAERLGLHLTYEYDGCGVMCRENDAEVQAKIRQLIQHVQARSERLWRIRPVLVVKAATDSGSTTARLHQRRIQRRIKKLRHGRRT